MKFEIKTDKNRFSDKISLSVAISIITFFAFNTAFKNRVYETLFMSGINTNYEFNISIQNLYGQNNLLNSPS